MRLGKEFFAKDAEEVAKKLLGKILVRKAGDNILRTRIIETEAYFDEKDPASRACKNGDLKKVMEMEGGNILVYGVHNNWLINFVVGEKGKAEAVLLRALEPLNFNDKCNGPGLLCKALKIDKSFHKKMIGEEIWIEASGENKEFEIIYRNRVGVSKDLKRKLRFYIKGSKVSRK